LYHCFYLNKISVFVETAEAETPPSTPSRACRVPPPRYIAGIRTGHKTSTTRYRGSRLQGGTLCTTQSPLHTSVCSDRRFLYTPDRLAPTSNCHSLSMEYL
jgi:hypothetical protein